MKDDDKILTRAQEIFAGTGIKIITEGKRMLGSFVGTDEGKHEYVKKKVEDWIQDIRELSEIGWEEPQIALSAYVKGLCHRWKFIQRTLKGISQLFQPLEEAIRSDFLPSIVGREISDLERNIMALPVRYGGLGVGNPVHECEKEYEASYKITLELKELMRTQTQDIHLVNFEKIDESRKEIKNMKERKIKEEYDGIVGECDGMMKRQLELAQEKGSSSWLTCLPLQHLGYCLNKQGFRDSLCLRYGWTIKGTPSYCACGTKSEINHTLNVTA